MEENQCEEFDPDLDIPRCRICGAEVNPKDEICTDCFVNVEPDNLTQGVQS